MVILWKLFVVAILVATNVALGSEIGTTLAPTLSPTFIPTVTPTLMPTTTPTKSPTTTPTKSPTTTPTKSPTTTPTKSPTATPTKSPTATPTKSPTATPTKSPTATPTATPTKSPTTTPTKSPTATPTKSPTTTPTATPTKSPTATPTKSPTTTPTATPTKSPTATPTKSPTSTAIQLRKIKVGIYRGFGTSSYSFYHALETLACNPDKYEVSTLTSKTIANILNNDLIDLLIIGGGFSISIFNRLCYDMPRGCPEAREVVRNFVMRGGGYLGVCAGNILGQYRVSGRRSRYFDLTVYGIKRPRNEVGYRTGFYYRRINTKVKETMTETGVTDWIMRAPVMFFGGQYFYSRAFSKRWFPARWQDKSDATVMLKGNAYSRIYYRRRFWTRPASYFLRYQPAVVYNKLGLGNVVLSGMHSEFDVTHWIGQNPWSWAGQRRPAVCGTDNSQLYLFMVNAAARDGVGDDL